MSGRIEPEFMDLPPVGRRQDDDEWADTIAALVKRSGEWARIFAGDYKEAGRLAARIRESRGGWSGHRWESATRSSGRGKGACLHVFARHIKSLNNEGDEQ